MPLQQDRSDGNTLQYSRQPLSHNRFWSDIQDARFLLFFNFGNFISKIRNRSLLRHIGTSLLPVFGIVCTTLNYNGREIECVFEVFHMLEKIKDWLGLSEQDDYVKDYFYRSNMKAVIYMSVVVICLELWMILRLTRIVIISWPRSFDWLYSHYRNYVILLVAGVIALIYAERFIRGKAKNRKVGTFILWTFSIICILFGIQVGVSSYAAGEQVLTFLTMAVFVFCILYWKPLESFFFSSISFFVFYVMLDRAIPASAGTKINLFTMWITAFMVAMSAYHQKISEAQKGESLEGVNAHLTRISNEDELTEIPNMRCFRRVCTANIVSSVKNRESHTFLYFDIERFKAYNEKYGFKKGDALLKQIAALLSEIFEGEPIARFSDDHFVAYADISTMEEKINQFRERVSALDSEVRLDVKIGSCTPAMASNDISLACDRARVACNALKRQYKKFYLAYDEALEKKITQKQYIINNIDNAVANGWIKVFYQPVVKCAGGNGELVGLEALARWDDPELGLLPPFMFIETLEEYMEIHKLDQCIVTQVCQHLREDIDRGRPVVPVSLNFSRLDFELYDVPQFLNSVAEEYNIPSSLLDVEITESALTDQFGLLQENMTRLRNKNFSLWLDDFGSGYSSLNVLKDFTFNVLKIDMKFLRDFPANQKSVPIITMIVDLAKQLGMVTLCEGVETREQYEFLQSVGCDKAQGYYFDKPLPRDAMVAKYYETE